MDHAPAPLEGRRGPQSPGLDGAACPGAGRHDLHLQAPDRGIRLTALARPESVVLVRRAVAALAEAQRFPPARVDDVKLAVTEACTNVVRHAYSGGEGTLEVAVIPGDGSLEVVVADRGGGLRPDASGGGTGLGLPLIAALANTLEIQNRPGSGTGVRMCFGAAGDTLQAA
jgi:anti-sigma regulatory factor (Ser/Thr protein kinase)